MTMRSILLLWAFMLGAIGGVLSGRAYEKRNRVVLQSIDTLRVVQNKLDTLYKTQRVTATQWRTEYDTARVTDTLMRADTVYVRRDIADSVIDSCFVLVSTCERRVANLQTQVYTLDEAWERAESNARRWKWLTYAATLALGASLIR